ncbi:MAG: AsmA family protein [Candidatus Omnitrophota bacterium]
MKKIITIIAVVLISLLVLGVLKDQIIKTTITVATSAITGAPTKIDGFSLGLFKQSVKIRGFKMYNPAGFPKTILVDIPKIQVDYDLGALLKRKLHLRLVELDLKELDLVKNKEGKLNVDALKVAQPQEKAAPAKEKETKKQAPAQLAMQIDELRLNIGGVVYKDYTAGEPPAVQVYDLNLKDKVYKNIGSAQELTALIIRETLGPTAIKGAATYGASMLLGVGFLPAGVAMTMAGKDSSQQTFKASFDKTYGVALATLEEMGKVKSKNKDSGTIKALVNKNDVTLKIEKVSNTTTQITAMARRLMLPKPEIASGVLYQISKKLK